MAPGPGKPSFFGPLALGIALYLCVEPLVFRRSAFGRLASPSGSTGRVIEVLRRNESPASGGPREVLVVGDSRMAEGFSAERASSPDLAFVNAAVPGSSLRIWHYLVRELDPSARRFAAIVIPTLCFEDHDLGDYESADPAGRGYDLRFCAPLLGIGDLLEFASSFPTLEEQVQAARGVLLRGFAYKHDLQAAFTSPFERIRELRRPFAVSDRSAAEYDGREQEAAAADQELARRTVARSHPAAVVADYRERWFSLLLARHAGSPTKILVIQVPRGPVAGPRPEVQTTSVLRRLASAGKVTLLRDELFLDLERGDRFFDSLHLNRAGRHEFSARLAREVGPLVTKGR